MLESVFNISIAALIAGFVFAMPIAGPISILIVSNALNGKRHYSNLVSIGAATSDSLYVFIAVYGLTRFYSFYKPAIPYLFLIGSLFFIYLSHKIYNTKIDLEQLEEETHVPEKIRNRDRGGFYTGFMINLLNPTLFLSGLISAFFVISFVASLGLNTGG
jgi:threonine/homoserine/homoserine lactone efflux protein